LTRERFDHATSYHEIDILILIETARGLGRIVIVELPADARSVVRAISVVPHLPIIGPTRGVAEQLPDSDRLLARAVSEGAVGCAEQGAAAEHQVIERGEIAAIAVAQAQHP